VSILGGLFSKKILKGEIITGTQKRKEHWRRKSEV